MEIYWRLLKTFGDFNVKPMLYFHNKLKINKMSSNSLFKVNDQSNVLASNTLYDSIRLEQNGNKKNLNPKFKNQAKNQMWPTESLFAIIPPAISSPFDILNKPRNATNTTIGAYQFIAN